MHGLVKRDDVIYWEKVAVDDEGTAVFAEPVVIKCRWDTLQTNRQDEDAVTTLAQTNTVYPDRILTIGGYLLLGNDEDLDELTYEERRDPQLIPNARRVNSQSTIFELGWEQINPTPNYQSEHMTIECSVG